MRRDDNKDLAKIYTENVHQFDEGWKRSLATGALRTGAAGMKGLGRHLLSWLKGAVFGGGSDDANRVNTPEMEGGGQVVSRSGVINRRRI